MANNEYFNPRFEHSGKNTIRLNSIQKRQKSTVGKKIQKGIYELEYANCPICGEEDDFEQISEQDRYGLYHPVAVCRSCGLVQARPRLTQDSYAEFYRKEYRLLYHGEDDWEANLFDSQYERAESVYGYIDEVCGLSGTENVLDVGAGTGGMLAYFQNKNHDCIGCDLDSSAVAYAASKDVPVHECTIDGLDLDWEPDVVILSHIVEHFLHPIDELENIIDVAADDAIFFIEVPGLKSINEETGYYGADLLRQLQIAHVYYFTIQTLNNLITATDTIAPIQVDYAPALERGGEMGHIRALCTNTKTSTDNEIEPDYKQVMQHLEELSDSDGSRSVSK